MELQPTYTYKIRVETSGVIDLISANLTRGQFNKVDTGTFLGFVHTIPHKNILISCKCHRCIPTEAFWDTLENIEESGFANCEICELPCFPVTK